MADTQINPGKAGPKGALEEQPAKGSKKPPRSGTRGNEGNNTRRDFVRLPKRSKSSKKRS